MAQAPKTRLDLALCNRGFFETRARAQAAIMAGLVKLNGAVESKAGHPVREDDVLELVNDPCPYVSRGGLKLKAALEHFKVPVAGLVCLDVGASTGGFTDCFIKEGAELAYAIDVGRGQFSEKLISHPKIRFIPETNARYLKADLFDPKPAVAAIDVSFISLKLILEPVINAMARPADLLILIKPQFELEPKKVPHGIVQSDEYRAEAVDGIRRFIAERAQAMNLEDLGLTDSPIKGAHGNREFLLHIRLH